MGWQGHYIPDLTTAWIDTGLISPIQVRFWFTPSSKKACERGATVLYIPDLTPAWIDTGLISPPLKDDDDENLKYMATMSILINIHQIDPPHT
jgi:hypothetical protein